MTATLYIKHITSLSLLTCVRAYVQCGQVAVKPLTLSLVLHHVDMLTPFFVVFNEQVLWHLSSYFKLTAI